MGHVCSPIPSPAPGSKAGCNFCNLSERAGPSHGSETGHRSPALHPTVGPSHFQFSSFHRLRESSPPRLHLPSRCESRRRSVSLGCLPWSRTVHAPRTCDLRHTMLTEDLHVRPAETREEVGPGGPFSA